MKKFEVCFLVEAIADLDALYSYIAAESSFEIADSYLARIELLCFSLESFPKRGTAVIGRVPGLRTMGFERRATILFRAGEERVDILRILYGGRNIQTALDDLRWI